MTWKERDGILIKDGFYLEPVTPFRIAAHSYELTKKILNDREEKYKEKKPLLLPLMRGGSQIFLYVSGGFRKVLCTREGEEIDYVPIKISRYGTGGIGVAGKPKVDSVDVEQAIEHLKQHDEAIIIDDIFDHGESTDTVQKILLETGKEILIATPDRIPLTYDL
ncbi:hypothetical protein HYZ41_01175 [archaeon]|nr:hypothetical protein [archaeon]